MRNEDLEKLLEKFYKGETTNEEENVLKAFFSENIVPDNYETEKAIFSYYFEKSEVPEPSSDFEARIISGIDKSVSKGRYTEFRRYLLPAVGIAAGLLIITGSWFFFVNRNETRDTFTDPKLAYAETVKILTEVSVKLNRGARALEPVSKFNEIGTGSFKVINNTTKIVEKNLMNLVYLKEARENSKVPVEKNVNK